MQRIALQLDAAHWRERARAARALAEEMSDQESRSRMLRIAADYEKLAERAEISQAITN